MKKFIFLFTLSIFTISVFGQDYSELNKQIFNNSDDYKNAEIKVLECSNYLINNPINQNELNRLNSIQFILKWMEGTPDYTFSLGEESMKLTKGNDELFSIYLASMVKTVLENPEIKMTDIQVHEKATEYLVGYCSNPDNNLKPSKAIKKLLKKRNG